MTMKFVSKVPLIFIVFFFLFQSSNSSNLISESCKEILKKDPTLKYDLCVTILEEASSKLQPPPNNLRDLAGLSIQLCKSNATNVLSIISKFLKDKSFDQNVKQCLQDCSRFYSASLKNIDIAMVAFKSKDFSKASINLGASTYTPLACEHTCTKQKGETSPLTRENQVFSDLSVMSLYFVEASSTS